MQQTIGTACLVTFSHDTTLSLNVRAHSHIKILSKDIASLPIKVEAPTHAALKLLLDSPEDSTMGLRPGHPNIAVLIVISVLSIKTMPFAQNILLFQIFQWLQAVGIGITSICELNAVASDPLHFLVSTTFNFGAITDLQQCLLRKLCYYSIKG